MLPLFYGLRRASTQSITVSTVFKILKHVSYQFWDMYCLLKVDVYVKKKEVPQRGGAAVLNTQRLQTGGLSARQATYSQIRQKKEDS